MRQHFMERGWCAFPFDHVLADWVKAVRPAAQATLADPELRAEWLRCGETWFAGVNALANDERGGLAQASVPPLAGSAVDFVHNVLGFRNQPWDRAQVSICFPGYPRPSDGESEAAFRFRRDRDAAHVDGLRRHEPGRRRKLGETHAFILGIPLTDTCPDAAPFTIYEGSHELMRAAFRERFAGIAPDLWAGEDITETYTATRRLAFQTCPRVPIHARPGEAYLAHRLSLHGVAPWGASEETGPRAILYFRPELEGGFSPQAWLDLP